MSSKNKENNIGTRMKENYEDRYRFKLTRRTPVIIRLDGKSFSNLTRNCRKPFDENFINTMNCTMTFLCQEIQGVKCAYSQSDEISLLLSDFDNLMQEAWFDYNLQKVVSVSSSIASSYFTLHWSDRVVCFDSRAFNIPKEEVCNYFIWRQKDWFRNSIQMLSQAYFSSKELHKKKTADMHEMLYSVNISWNDLQDHLKNGSFCVYDDGWKISSPIFTENRSIIEQFLEESQ